MSRRILLAAVALVSVVSGCLPSGPQLDQYSNLQVDIGASTHPTTGVASLRLQLSGATGRCIELSPEVRATLNGVKMKTESFGEYESSVLGGMFCDEPMFTLPLPSPGAGPAEFIIEDSSMEITVLVPDLFDRRTISLVSPGPVHPGDQVRVAWDHVSDDLSYLNAYTPIARCDLRGVIGVEQGETESCLDAGLMVRELQVEITVPPSIETGNASLKWNVEPAMPPSGPMALVASCSGAAVCRAAIPYPPEPLAITILP